MIGFFQNTMARHHKLMFAFLLVIIVVSFVFYTGSGSAMDLLGIRKSPKVCGVKLNDSGAEVYRKAVAIRGASDMSQDRYVQLLAQRIYFVDLAEKYEIPLPSQSELDAFTKQYFSDSDGKFSPQLLNAVMHRYGISDEMMKQILIHEWKIDRLEKMFASSPSMFNDDIALRWKELNTAWTMQTAKISVDSFKFERTPTDEELSAYYAENGEKYRIAPLVKLSYAVVKPTAEMRSKIGEPNDAELNRFVKTQLPKLSNDNDVAKEISTNRASWVKRWKDDRISVETASATSDMLAESLAQDAVNPKSPDFAEAVKKSGLTFTEIPAFPQNLIPKNSAIPQDILKGVVGSLNDTLWRTDAIPSGENALVVLFRGTEASRIPELAEVKGEVLVAWKNDMKESEFLKSALATGLKLRDEVAAGKTFEAAAKTLGMIVGKETKFTMQTVPADMQSYGQNVIEAVKLIPLKTVTGMIRAGDDALFACAVKKDVPTLNKEDSSYRGLVDYADRMTSYSTFRMQLGERLFEIIGSLQSHEDGATEAE